MTVTRPHSFLYKRVVNLNKVKERKGLIYVFEGEGKGKTSAALGTTVRMLCIGKRVVWISWFKQPSWNSAEGNLEKYFANMKMLLLGEGFYIKGRVLADLKSGARAYDNRTIKEHKEAAEKALARAGKELTLKNPPDLLILDEVIQAINEKLIRTSSLEKILKMRNQTHIVLTGRKCPASLRNLADLVTKMEKIKHPYDKGVLAIKGLDY